MIAELKTLIAVCKYGTFAAAGEHIGLTQSAVSSQIRRIEDSLGFALFERTGRSATLNSAGRIVLERAEVICALYARLGEPAHGQDARGTLRIGAIASAQATLLVRSLARFRERFASVRVHVTPGVSMRLMDELDAATIDAAIMIRPPFGMPPGMSWQPLEYEPFVLIAPSAWAGKKVHWRTLLTQRPFLRYERVSFGGRMVQAFLKRHAIAVTDAVELDEIAGLIQLVASGLGVALIPLVEAQLPLPAGVCVVTLGEHTFYREIGLMQKRAVASSSMAAYFSHCLQEAVRPQAAQAPAGRAQKRASTAGAGRIKPRTGEKPLR